MVFESLHGALKMQKDPVVPNHDDNDKFILVK